MFRLCTCPLLGCADFTDASPVALPPPPCRPPRRRPAARGARPAPPRRPQQRSSCRRLGLIPRQRPLLGLLGPAVGTKMRGLSRRARAGRPSGPPPRPGGRQRAGRLPGAAARLALPPPLRPPWHPRASPVPRRPPRRASGAPRPPSGRRPPAAPQQRPRQPQRRRALRKPASSQQHPPGNPRLWRWRGQRAAAAPAARGSRQSVTARRRRQRWVPGSLPALCQAPNWFFSVSCGARAC